MDVIVGKLVSDMIKHEGSKWKVYDSTGKKLLGTHPTKKEALAQLRAIEISKKEGVK